jgi:hypothetical protein
MLRYMYTAFFKYTYWPEYKQVSVGTRNHVALLVTVLIYGNAVRHNPETQYCITVQKVQLHVIVVSLKQF